MPDGEGGTEARVAAMHDHLDATAELPVTRESSAYLGEAAAVARDLFERDADEAVVRERAGHVVRLLDAVDATGHEAADEHVAAARAAAAELADDDGGN